MSKFIGLKKINNCIGGLDYNPISTIETSVIVNLDNIALLEVETQTLYFKGIEWGITLNENSTKFLLEILMENEYKLQVAEE